MNEFDGDLAIEMNMFGTIYDPIRTSGDDFNNPIVPELCSNALIHMTLLLIKRRVISMQSKNEALVVSIAHIPVFFSYQSYYICVVEIT